MAQRKKSFVEQVVATTADDDFWILAVASRFMEGRSIDQSIDVLRTKRRSVCGGGSRNVKEDC